MPATKIDQRVRPLGAAAQRDDELIARAAKRTDWAACALLKAAQDLGDARDNEGRALTGVAEVLLEQAERVSNLARDIQSHRPGVQDGSRRGDQSRGPTIRRGPRG